MTTNIKLKKSALLRRAAVLIAIASMVLCSAVPAFALVPIDHTTDPSIIKGWTRDDFAQSENLDVSVAPNIDYGDTFGAHGLITDMDANATESTAIINAWTMSQPDYIQSDAMKNYFTRFKAGPTFSATQLLSSSPFE